MNLYVFDFDGTIYNGDSMIDFLKLVHNSKIKYYITNILFTPFWVLKILGLIKIDNFKSYFLKIHFRYYDQTDLEFKSNEFSKTFHKKIYPKSLNFLESIEGEKVIVTPSVDIWMRDISKELKSSLISTKSVFENKRFLKIERNCNYDEKLYRIMEKYDLNNFKNIYVYGNSKGDYSMYKLGNFHHKFFQND